MSFYIYCTWKRYVLFSLALWHWFSFRLASCVWIFIFHLPFSILLLNFIRQFPTPKERKRGKWLYLWVWDKFPWWDIHFPHNDDIFSGNLIINRISKKKMHRWRIVCVGCVGFSSSKCAPGQTQVKQFSSFGCLIAANRKACKCFTSNAVHYIIGDGKHTHTHKPWQRIKCLHRNNSHATTCNKYSMSLKCGNHWFFCVFFFAHPIEISKSNRILRFSASFQTVIEKFCAHFFDYQHNYERSVFWK